MVLARCLRCSPQRFLNSSGSKVNNQGQDYYILSEGTDDCLMQSKIFFLLHCVFHTIHVLKGTALSLSLKKSEECVS